MFLEELKIFKPNLCKRKVHNWPEVNTDAIPYDWWVFLCGKHGVFFFWNNTMWYCNSGMHYYLRYVLTFASICGVFPVQKIYRKNLNLLSFSWFSILTIYSLLLLLGFLTIEIYSLDYTVRNLNEDNLTAKGKPSFILSLVKLFNTLALNNFNVGVCMCVIYQINFSST